MEKYELQTPAEKHLEQLEKERDAGLLNSKPNSLLRGVYKRIEVSQRALEQLDYSSFGPNRNPLE